MKKLSAAQRRALEIIAETGEIRTYAYSGHCDGRGRRVPLVRITTIRGLARAGLVERHRGLVWGNVTFGPITEAGRKALEAKA